ncbi:TRAP transporter large permease [Roseicella frigidaeris]|uniref:ABC transporter permease n=1 Tax=Roseicella frigidaeris TaxID=2230885 RepID=A0A327MCP1_9PROT|nr:TRAP transporter large permease subunit [Roseicella frigidaeris]RAI57948.1 ABC transporter permease [Roseicella frigidaeris]
MQAAEETMPGAPSGIRRQLGRAEAALGLAVEAVAGLLVAVETVVLFAGVLARYVFHDSLVWSDELASILFLWLAMLGAVVAFRRGEHMRMTALATRAPPALRGLLEALAVAAPILFLLLLLHPAIDYAVEESFIVTPALEIPGSWRAAALPTGLGLMLLMAVSRLLRLGGAGRTLGALALVVAVAGGFWLAGPMLAPLGNLNLLIFFVGLVAVTVLAGVPIAFCFGLATFGYLALTTRVPIMVVVGRMDEGMSHLILLAVPLFVFLGSLIEMTGMARAMIRFLANLLGHVRGGLSYVLVGAMYLVSGISGAKAADMAAVAPVLFPEMRERGAKPGDLVALLAATGAQTETIPPSLVLITIGSVTGVSIGALFTGGLLPGAVLALVLCLVVRWRHRGAGVARAAMPPAREILRSFVIAVPALALPFLIRAAVIEGVATATEVSTIGIAYGALAGLLIYRQFDWRRLGPILVETASLSGAILLIIGAATGMAWALTQSGFSRDLAAAMAALPGGRAGFLAVSILAFVVLGSVLEGIPAIVLFGPLLFPIARTMGVHEVHYAMVVILAMGIGLFAPPFGVGYYAACAISRISPDEGMRPIWGYMLALLIGTVVIAAVPWISIGFL